MDARRSVPRHHEAQNSNGFTTQQGMEQRLFPWIFSLLQACMIRSAVDADRQENVSVYQRLFPIPI
jgi:hypothetical protein